MQDVPCECCLCSDTENNDENICKWWNEEVTWLHGNCLRLYKLLINKTNPIALVNHNACVCFSSSLQVCMHAHATTSPIDQVLQEGPPLLWVWISNLVLLPQITGLREAQLYWWVWIIRKETLASFGASVDLKYGAFAPDHWIKRGTALLMSLDY